MGATLIDNLEGTIEGILFLSGQAVETEFLKDKLSISDKVLEKTIEKLTKKYSGESGVHLIRFKNKIQFSTNPNLSDTIAEVMNQVKEKALSKATLETLAIVAYKQPITRLEIEEIRGVSSDYAIEILDKNKLIEVIGRKDSVGKPLLFATTDEFLKRFKLTSLAELPNYDDLLNRLTTIKTMGEQPKASESLFNASFGVDEELLPDFLVNEKIEKVEG